MPSIVRHLALAEVTLHADCSADQRPQPVAFPRTLGAET